MRFKEGLLKARGQIAFLSALVISATVIIWLESQHIDGGRIVGPVDPAIREHVGRALVDAEEHYEAGDPNSASALLASLALAADLGIISRREGEARAERLLQDLEESPISPALRGALGRAAVSFPDLRVEILRTLNGD